MISKTAKLLPTPIPTAAPVETSGEVDTDKAELGDAVVVAEELGIAVSATEELIIAVLVAIHPVWGIDITVASSFGAGTVNVSFDGVGQAIAPFLLPQQFQSPVELL